MQFDEREDILWHDWIRLSEAATKVSNEANIARAAGRIDEANALALAYISITDHVQARYERLQAYRAPRGRATDGKLLSAERKNRAGCLDLHRSTVTGHVVGLYRAEEASLDPEGGPYATVCEQHHTICNHRTLRLARLHLDSAGWCEACQAEAVEREAKEDDDTYAAAVRS